MGSNKNIAMLDIDKKKMDSELKQMYKPITIFGSTGIGSREAGMWKSGKRM